MNIGIAISENNKNLDEPHRAPKHPIGLYYYRDVTCGCSVTVGVLSLGEIDLQR